MGGRRTYAVRGASIALAGALVAAGCGSKEQSGPTASADDLSCLTTLAEHCCQRALGCDPTWDNATLCSSWTYGTPLTVYASPCHDLRAIRVTAATYSTFYVYNATTSALVAVAYNAAADPGSTDIACGAGPRGFAIPRDCGAAWLGTSGAQKCDPTTGTGKATHDWCNDQYYGDGG